MRDFILALGILAAVLTACGTGAVNAVPTATSDFSTATLPATPAPSATSLPSTATPAPTSTPIAGTTTTKVNVRTDPLSGGTVLGTIGARTTVQVLGRDASGSWFEILVGGSPTGTGWVAAQYIEVPDKDAVPIAGGPTRSTAAVRETLNVRKGPGAQFDAVGILNPRDVVTLTGKDSKGVWLQIAYAAAPEGKGWVAASLVEASGVDRLPIVSDTGEVVGTSTATPAPAVPTPTVAPARDDGDSAEAPAVDVTFSPSGTGSIRYSSELSAPEGDAADWIRFTPHDATVTMALACRGEGSILGMLLTTGGTNATTAALLCGQTTTVTLTPGETYTLKLTIAETSPELKRVAYTLNIDNRPTR